MKKYYYWTHGLTNHTSDKYLFKAEGHQDLATMDNKMGGSKAYYSWGCKSGCVLVTNKINKLHFNKPEDSYHCSNSIIIAKGDSGASANYWHNKEKHILQNIKPNTSISVTLPNAQPINLASSSTIPLSNDLSEKAK